MADEILNKVAESNLILIELEDYLPKEEIMAYDLAQNLFQAMILREKDFRTFLKNNNWEAYRGKVVAISCSEDVIIPNWAYMLLTSKLNEFDARCYFGTIHQVKEKLLLSSLLSASNEAFRGKKVLVKGCGSFDLSPEIYVEVTALLRPLVNSLMFGEACSSVPVYKSGK
jgi:hypothetical protein